jgi:hypothetical protein
VLGGSIPAERSRWPISRCPQAGNEFLYLEMQRAEQWGGCPLWRDNSGEDLCRLHRRAILDAWNQERGAADTGMVEPWCCWARAATSQIHFDRSLNQGRLEDAMS